ncbi:MAG: hypothetical protein U1F35_13425 [Steroidobacteraceae bacterium]
MRSMLMAGLVGGAVVAGSVVGLRAVSVQHAAPPPATVQEVSEDDTTVCVGADGLPRVAADEGCPPNTESITLAGPNHEAKDLSDDTPDELSSASGGKKSSPGALDKIEGRIAVLEKAPLFEVVDKKGHPVFAVAPGSATTYGPSAAQPEAEMLATDEGGFFVGRSRDGTYEAKVGAAGDDAGLTVSEAGARRIQLGLGPGGNYGLRIFSRTDQLVAGIGESKAGSSVALVADAKGQVLASLMAGKEGSVSVFNTAGTDLLALTETANGGRLEIGAQSGEVMVGMTNNYGRYGVVMAGPGAGFPLVPSSGLPGSYFLGCVRSEACRP